MNPRTRSPCLALLEQDIRRTHGPTRRRVPAATDRGERFDGRLYDDAVCGTYRNDPRDGPIVICHLDLRPPLCAERHPGGPTVLGERGLRLDRR